MQLNFKSLGKLILSIFYLRWQPVVSSHCPFIWHLKTRSLLPSSKRWPSKHSKVTFDPSSFLIGCWRCALSTMGIASQRSVNINNKSSAFPFRKYFQFPQSKLIFWSTCTIYKIKCLKFSCKRTKCTYVCTVHVRVVHVQHYLHSLQLSWSTLDWTDTLLQLCSFRLETSDLHRKRKSRLQGNSV